MSVGTLFHVELANYLANTKFKRTPYEVYEYLEEYDKDDKLNNNPSMEDIGNIVRNIPDHVALVVNRMSQKKGEKYCR